MRNTGENRENDWIGDLTSGRCTEDVFRTLFESSGDGMMLIHPLKGFIRGNAAILRLFRCATEAEFLTRSPADLSPDNQPDGAWSSAKSHDMMRIALDTGYHAFDWLHCRTDGTTFPAFVTLSRIELRGKRFLFATVREITEQKRAEVLWKTNEYLESLFECANAPIIVWDSHSVITRVNRVCEEITGRPAAEIVGKPLDSLIPESVLARTKELIYGVRVPARNGNPWRSI